MDATSVTVDADTATSAQSGESHHRTLKDLGLSNPRLY